MIRIIKNDFSTGDEYGDGQTCYGFMVYDDSGKSMPKGAITSYNATAYRTNGLVRQVVVEFGIQSPTGDSSDHHHYTFPCLTYAQAVDVVNRALEDATARYAIAEASS